MPWETYTSFFSPYVAHVFGRTRRLAYTSTGASMKMEAGRFSAKTCDEMHLSALLAERPHLQKPLALYFQWRVSLLYPTEHDLHLLAPFYQLQRQAAFLESINPGDDRLAILKQAAIALASGVNPMFLDESLSPSRFAFLRFLTNVSALFSEAVNSGVHRATVEVAHRLLSLSGHSSASSTIGQLYPSDISRALPASFGDMNYQPSMNFFRRHQESCGELSRFGSMPCSYRGLQ